MPTTRAPRNFEVISVRRRGIEAIRTPQPGEVLLGSVAPGLVVTLPDTTAPTTPVLSASAISSTGISIAMPTPSTDAGGIQRYELERATSSSGPWTQLSSSASFPFSSTGLSASTTYFFRARAIDNAGNVGSYSTTVNATTQSGGAGVIIFAKDYSSAASPLAGMSPSFFVTDTQHNPVWWTCTRQATGWVDGRSCYRVNFPRIADTANNFGMGWEEESFGDWTFGSTMFVRWRLRLTDSTNMLTVDSNGDAANWYNKIMTIYGYGTSSRVILQTYHSLNPARLGFTLQKDGGSDAISIGGDFSTPFAPGQVINLQLRIGFSSAQNVANGNYAAWFNNNTLASPTMQASNIVVNANGGSNPQMNYAHGGYLNNSTAAGGVIAYDETDFQIGTAFDPNWNQ